jgi:hypothetical protein
MQLQTLFLEHQVDELVHVGELELSAPILNPDLPVVAQQGLNVLVAVPGTHQCQTVGSQSGSIPGRVVLVWLKQVITLVNIYTN